MDVAGPEAGVAGLCRGQGERGAAERLGGTVLQARDFYAGLEHGPAEALRRATLALAAAQPRNPSFWAGHVHVGPS